MNVITLNINGYSEKHGAWEKRRTAICSAITQRGCDLVLLQAVRHDPQRNGALNQADEICRALGPAYRAIYTATQLEAGGVSEGLAVITSAELIAAAFTPLAHNCGADDPVRRGVLITRCRLRGRSFTAVNCHFSWVTDEGARNAADLARLLKGAAAGSAILVGGDFNSPPDGPAPAKLREMELCDLWLRRPERENGATYESPSPTMRIDYLWADSALAEQLSAIEIFGAGSEALSNHCGLAASFTWEEDV